MSHPHHDARILAMQWLCHHEVQSGDASETIDAIACESGAGRPAVDYARSLCRRYVEKGRRVDEAIEAALQHWSLDRIDTVDRNVMRVAVVELLDRDVPPRVVLNEAVEIAREYGTADSPRFVNGVLDAVWKNADSLS